MKDDVVVNGITIGPNTDLRSLLKQQLLGDGLLAGRYDETPDQGIWSLFTAARGTGIEPRLIEAVKALLTDGDLQVRAGAVGLTQAFAEKFQAADLFALLNGEPRLFEGVAGLTAGQPDLAWGMLRAIAGAQNWTPAVLVRIRGAALDLQNGLTVLAGLVNHDPNWVIEHAQEVIDNQPARAGVILHRLKDPVLRQSLVRQLPRESPELRKVMAQAVSEEVTDQKERDRLLELLR